jgi:hypothetical protein
LFYDGNNVVLLPLVCDVEKVGVAVLFQKVQVGEVAAAVA